MSLATIEPGTETSEKTGDVRILTTVTIQEVLDGRSYRATLANGKLVLAFALPLDRVPPLQVGDRSRAILSLCDFNEARLIPDVLTGVRIEHPIVDGGGHGRA
ncbi:hypothetical protein [Roseimicrobium sp. ORNL1]|uniref:hypothetical protein n=1 Tax=Roseimicrobium sp. ORNL1 TaxID=2711231 RepID=UPI0013E1269B|nr:hypothetical protein [Roseimicrobium sp. ORNL1]QIF04012.1 hypothetical protein G5S37_21600 [Roseimicrobium sp. ORNL1]